MKIGKLYKSRSWYHSDLVVVLELSPLGRYCIGVDLKTLEKRHYRIDELEEVISEKR
jgi:hypothetical protein